MAVGAGKIWSVAIAAAVLVGGASAAFMRQQWRSDMDDAVRAGSTNLAQLAPLIEDELRSARYADVPEVIQGWGAADPSIVAIKIEAHSGYSIAEYARAAHDGPRLGFDAPLSYGYGGHARVSLETDLSPTLARRNELALELGAANLVIDAAIIAVAVLLVLNRKAVRRYRTVSAVNQALLGDGTTGEFLQTICSAAVREGGYVLAWIGLMSDTSLLLPGAVAGSAAGYAEGLRLSSDANDPDGQGPNGIAVRERRPVWTNHFQRAPRTKRWWERARRFGIRSSAALPLIAEGRAIGVLALYSSARRRFEGAEQALALQMAGDIALGIEHQRRGVQIERSRAQLRDIMDGMLVFVSLATIEGVVVEVNRAALAAAGLRAADVVGTALADTRAFGYSEDVRARLQQALRRVARGEVVRYDETVRVAGEQRLAVDLTLAPLRGAGGEPTQVVLSAVDISARAQLEARLSAESERNRLFLRSASDGVHILDDAGRVVEVSDSFCALLGYRAEELIGAHPTLWDAESERERIDAAVARLMAGEQLRFETVLRRKDGSLVDVELSCNGFQVRGQHFAYCAARDLTEIKRLQRELLGAVASEQRRLGQELHDGLGQELTGATLIARALATRAERDRLPLAEGLHELADLISRSIGSARRIVRGLSPLTDVNGDLAAALGELAASNSAGGTDVRFTEEVHAPLTLSMEARGHLFRIAQEAVQNALKHAHARRIDVRLAIESDVVRLSIGDDGVGLPAPSIAGAGYGMQTMRYRAAALRGRLTLNARPGGGTVVECSAPQVPPLA